MHDDHDVDEQNNNNKRNSMVEQINETKLNILQTEVLKVKELLKRLLEDI